jgi:hypothetical protein
MLVYIRSDIVNKIQFSVFFFIFIYLLLITIKVTEEDLPSNIRKILNDKLERFFFSHILINLNFQ